MRVLVRRHGDGIGDWLLLLQALKNVNVQRPDVELVVDFHLPPLGRNARELSPLVRRAFECSDVKWTPYRAEAMSEFDVTIDHVVYERLGYESYVGGMVRDLSERTTLDLVCDEDLVPVYSPQPFQASILGRYAALVSQGKAETGYKNWGVERFEYVGQRLAAARGCDLVQVGAAGDYLLQGAKYVRFLGVPFDALVTALQQSNVVVCVENCIAVLAAQLHKRTACIYTRDINVGRLKAPTFVPFLEPAIEDVVDYCARCF